MVYQYVDTWTLGKRLVCNRDYFSFSESLLCFSSPLQTEDFLLLHVNSVGLAMCYSSLILKKHPKGLLKSGYLLITFKKIVVMP